MDGAAVIVRNVELRTIPPCPTDIAGNNSIIDVFDLFKLLGNSGNDGPGANLAAPTDTIDVFDLFELLSA